MKLSLRRAVLFGAVALGLGHGFSAARAEGVASVYSCVDYIKSTRAQRIATDYYPNPKTWMEVDLKFEGTFRYSNGTGDAGLPAGTCANIFYSPAGDNKALYSANFGAASHQSKEVFFWLEKGYVSSTWTIKTVPNTTRNTLTVEKTKVTWGSGSVVPETKTLTCENPLYILGNNEKSFGSYDAYVYSWKIYESDTGAKGGANQTLVHDFVPAKDANGVAGLYDKVAKKFLSSATATAFVAGTETGVYLGEDVVTKPTVTATILDYTGKEQGPDVVVPAGVTVSGTQKATKVGSYTMTLTLDKGKVWEDGTTDPMVINWYIQAVPNYWTTLPTVSRTRYCVGDKVTATAGTALQGEVVATLDGKPFSGTLPQTAGEYVLSYDVAETATYAGLHYAFNLKVSSTYTKGARSLPSEYATVDYVSSENTFKAANEADGGAYVKLGFNLTSTDCIKTKVRFAAFDTTKDASKNGVIFSTRKAYQPGSYTLFRLGAKFRMDYDSVLTEAGEVSANQDYEIAVTAGSLDVNNSRLVTNEPASFEVQGDALYLFAAFTTGTPSPSNFCKMRMYYFDVYGADGGIKHQLVPVQRKNDSAIGFYDYVDEKFYPSTNATRAFNAFYGTNSLMTRLENSPDRVESSPYASGGDYILKVEDTYIHVFANAEYSTTFTMVKALPYVDTLLVAGGGGGGNRGGGGGAGGMLEQTGKAWLAGEYTIQVGAGGAAGVGKQKNGGKGGDSYIALGSADISRAEGGGYGAGGEASTTVGGNGGSGGGAHKTGGTGVAGQGYAGGASSGTVAGSGGGAGGAGVGSSQTGWAPPGMAGGSGRTSDILGFRQYFAGGGGSAGGAGASTGGAGGIGGGGKGNGYNCSGDAGVNGLGGGGGGGGGNDANYYDGGKGGSGIIVIAYKTAGISEPTGGKISVPTAIPGLVYDGTEQTGVAEGTGYTLEDNTATEGGEYTAVATLEEGFTWSNGSTDPAQIAWSIAAAENVWTTTPAIDNVNFGSKQVASVTLTPGVAKFGTVVATIAKDGGEPTTFGGSLPTDPGAYALTYAVEACASWTAITKTLNFNVYPFDIKPWTSDFIGDLTTNAYRVVGSDFAEGGDMILKYPSEEGQRDTYVHVFTDTSVDAAFTVARGKILRDAEVLVVGAGGGAGGGEHPASWTFHCAGGGEGGEVVTNLNTSLDKTILVHVGAGGAGGGSKTSGTVGGESSFTNVAGTVRFVAAGGRGGLGASTTDGVARTGNGGAGQASNGNITSDMHGLPGSVSTALGYAQYFGGGGAGGTHSVNGAGTRLANGGLGGGGSSCSDTYKEAYRYAYPGADGLGGGGAGGWMTGTKQSFNGRKGGSGIVVIRYSKVSSKGMSIIIR